MDPNIHGQIRNAKNCRWATHREQAANRCSTRFITHNGDTQCIAEWARRFGIESGLLLRRLERGQTMEQATSQKGNPRHKMLTLGSRTQSLAEWSRELKIKQNTLWGRVQKGWTDEKILTHPHGLAERNSEKMQAAVRKRSRHITAFGRTLTLTEWSQSTGISKSAISARVITGMPPELALTMPKQQGKKPWGIDARKKRRG